MRKSWLGAALLGAWLSATADAQNPNPANPPGRATISSGAVPLFATPPSGVPGGGPFVGGMPDPVPLSVGTPMPPAGAAGMPPGHQGMPNGAPVPPSNPPGMYPGSGMGAYPTNMGMDGRGDVPHEMHGHEGGATIGRPVWYAIFGAVTLQRDKISGTLALRDPFTVDTGVPPPPNSPIAATFEDMEMDWMVGYRIGIGYHRDNKAIELSGFYIPQDSSFHSTFLQGRLDSFFFNPPIGFEGNNFLWLQADEITTSLRTALGSAELNFRWWTGKKQYFSWLIGARYIDLWERLRIFTDDDSLTVRDAFGRPDPTRQATYTIRTHNRIIAPQLGFEWNIPLNPWLAATWSAKGAWGANFIQADARLVRGDGFRGFSNSREETNFSHLYDAGFYLDWKVGHRCKLRTGYSLLWLVHVATAVEQVDFNLEHTKGRRSLDGDVFYHGPTVELHVLF